MSGKGGKGAARAVPRTHGRLTGYERDTGHGPEDAEAQSSLGHFLERFKGVSTRRLHSCLMWFRWLREAARVGDRTSLMREQLDDGRYEKIRKKMMEPEYEFHLEPDVQTAG